MQVTVQDRSDRTPPTSADGSSDPWRDLRRQQDRRRYLTVLTPKRLGKDKPRRPNPALGLPRTGHHLLFPPARLTRTATNSPAPDQVRHYLRHSADLTVSGGLATCLAHPLAVCALAEHYVFRRIAGSGPASVAAAAAAAAEFGRVAPDPGSDRPPLSVAPGFAGLAEAVGWLGGQDQAGQDQASLAQRVPGENPAGPLRWGRRSRPAPGSVSGVTAGPEQWRLARLFRPGPDTRVPYRLLVSMLRARAPRRGSTGGTGRGTGPVIRTVLGSALVGSAGGVSRTVTLLGWAGGLLAQGGITLALLAAPVPTPLALAAALAVLLALATGGLVAAVLAFALGLRRLLDRDAERHGFGLVPGVDAPGTAAPRASRLDALAGVPAAGDVPALVEWLADRLDDLAGMPPAGHGTDRRALTFGDLWLGRSGPRTSADIDALRRAADDPEHRCIDLTLVTTDLSEGRPRRWPLHIAERAGREGDPRFLFCRTCLEPLLPARVVDQLVDGSPALDPDHTCPRHRSHELRELPEPWDLPVIAALRPALSTPGLIRSLPLVTVEEVRPGAVYDPHGREAEAAPRAATATDRTGPDGTVPNGIGTTGATVDSTGTDGTRNAGPARGASGPSRRAAQVHWFCEGRVTAGIDVGHHDALLPRWPSFGLTVDRLPGGAPLGREVGLADGLAEWRDLPPQDGHPHRLPWRAVPTSSAFVRALFDAATGWGEVVQAQQPGLRGRSASVRLSDIETANGVFLGQAQILQLAMRGYHAGAELRTRFTGPDGEVDQQTQTDRYRWIRLRAALRGYHDLSVSIAARLPLYTDLAGGYRVPAALADWFSPPIEPGALDPSWADAGATLTHLRALSAGGVLDWDTDRGAPPRAPDAPRYTTG